MRYRVRLDQDVPDRKWSVSLDQAQVDIGIEQSFQSPVGPCRHPSGQRVLAREARDAADVIVMLVRYDDGGELFGANTEAGRAGA